MVQASVSFSSILSAHDREVSCWDFGVRRRKSPDVCAGDRPKSPAASEFGLDPDNRLGMTRPSTSKTEDTSGGAAHAAGNLAMRHRRGGDGVVCRSASGIGKCRTAGSIPGIRSGGSISASWSGPTCSALSSYGCTRLDRAGRASANLASLDDGSGRIARAHRRRWSSNPGSDPTWICV